MCHSKIIKAQKIKHCTNGKYIYIYILLYTNKHPNMYKYISFQKTQKSFKKIGIQKTNKYQYIFVYIYVLRLCV